MQEDLRARRVERSSDSSALWRPQRGRDFSQPARAVFVRPKDVRRVRFEAFTTHERRVATRTTVWHGQFGRWRANSAEKSRAGRRSTQRGLAEVPEHRPSSSAFNADLRDGNDRIASSDLLYVPNVFEWSLVGGKPMLPGRSKTDSLVAVAPFRRRGFRIRTWSNLGRLEAAAELLINYLM